MKETDTLKQINDLGEDWDGLSKEERIERLEGILHAEKGEPEDVEIPLEDKITMAKLDIAVKTIVEFGSSCMPIPHNLIDYYNEQVKALCGFGDEVFKFAEDAFAVNIPRLEEAMLSHFEEEESSEGEDE